MDWQKEQYFSQVQLCSVLSHCAQTTMVAMMSFRREPDRFPILGDSSA
jgi:hypothetical protein